MYNVNFKTDQALYDKFRIICTINKEKLQEVLTELIRKYVTENEKLIDNPETKQRIQPELPGFFDEPEKWFHYVNRMDEKTFEKSVNRMTFQKYLFNYYATQHDNDIKYYEKFKLDSFKKSKDSRFLAEHHIYSTIEQLKPIYANI